jgi:hypothetical protein
LLSEFLAIKCLCHTNIHREAQLRRADQDTFGRNVSFEAVRHSDEAMTTVDVDFGIALVLDGPAPDATVSKVQKHLCDSATCESRPEAD